MPSSTKISESLVRGWCFLNPQRLKLTQAIDANLYHYVYPVVMMFAVWVISNLHRDTCMCYSGVQSYHTYSRCGTVYVCYPWKQCPIRPAVAGYVIRSAGYHVLLLDRCDDNDGRPALRAKKVL